MIVSLISSRSTRGGRLGASIAAAVWLALAPAAPAGAQTLTRGTLKMVVPFAPGGPSDVAGRIVAAGLSEVLGRSVIVENPAGAGGTIGSLRVSRSTPDGSEFVLANSGTHVWSQALYKTPPYNTLTDFTPLGLVVEAPRVIITPKNFPADTLQELIAYLKAKKGTAKYGHAGAGSASHVSCILFNAAIGVDIVAVPYRGLGPAMQDLTAGRIDYLCDSPSTSKPQINGGFVKAIATTGEQRWYTLAQVPTVREQGVDFVITTWQGLFLAQNTPEPIVRELNAALSKALDLPLVRERFTQLGEQITPPEHRSPEYFRKFVTDEIVRWSGPIKASGVTVE
jgi:tripartite-type tricarboxylate transporter receptor subunit TctC